MGHWCFTTYLIEGSRNCVCVCVWDTHAPGPCHVHVTVSCREEGRKKNKKEKKNQWTRNYQSTSTNILWSQIPTTSLTSWDWRLLFLFSLCMCVLIDWRRRIPFIPIAYKCRLPVILMCTNKDFFIGKFHKFDVSESNHRPCKVPV